MKKLSQTLIVAILSLTSWLACDKKSNPPSSGGQVCANNSMMGPGQYCSNGQIIQAPVCNYNQIPPQGQQCYNGYLMPINGIGGMVNMVNGVRFSNSYFEGSINFSGSMANQLNGPAVISNYAGAISVMGSLQVMNQSLCGAPMGKYQVTGTGSMSAGVIQNMQWTITGPGSMSLMISSAVLERMSGMDGNFQETRLGILQSQLIVNGQPCGVITTY